MCVVPCLFRQVPQGRDFDLVARLYACILIAGFLPSPRKAKYDVSQPDYDSGCIGYLLLCGWTSSPINSTISYVCKYEACLLGLTVINMIGERLAQLSTLGTGLLLGAAMGVIIPEYVTLVLIHRDISKALL